MMVRLALLVVLARVAASPAHALVSLPAAPAPVKGNPAERLRHQPIESSYYEPATRCMPRVSRPGAEAFAWWLSRNATGGYRGTYRWERWRPGRASLDRAWTRPGG